MNLVQRVSPPTAPGCLAALYTKGMWAFTKAIQTALRSDSVEEEANVAETFAVPPIPTTTGGSASIAPARSSGFMHPHKVIEALAITPGMIVADFGAGSGVFTLALARAVGAHGRVYAIDVQKDGIRRILNEARKHNLEKRVSIIWGDLEQDRGSKIADRLVDRVVVSNLLFQVPDKRAILAEARRILKPGGELAIIDWEDSFAGMGPRPEDVVTHDTARSLARSGGFEIVRECDAGAHHYGIIVRPTFAA